MFLILCSSSDLLLLFLQQLDELRDVNKTVLLQKKEIAQLNERYLSKQKECEKLEAEVKRLKSIESWSSVSPSSSTDDLTSAGQVCSKFSRVN